jgi:hypothetical protein
MTLRKAAALALALALGVLAAWTLSADARKPRKPTVRSEIARLKARIAELESRVSFQGRTTTPGGRDGALYPLPGGFCGDPCATDSDGDGVGDCEDSCPCDAGNADRDGDASPDCWDPCPDDATDACIDPCRQDSDGDGVTDCDDPCAWDASPPVDDDGDGIPKCADPCPGDPDNTCYTPCPLDADGDGIRDCGDPCPWGAKGPCVSPPTGVAEPGAPPTRAR